MKKRILALALAATTAFSMFGASLSVSAADAESTKVAALINTADYSEVVGSTTYAVYDEFIEDMEAVQALIVEDEGEAVDATKYIYAYDYTSASWTNFQNALDAALEAGVDTSAAYVTVYTTLAEAVKTAAANLALDKNNGYTASALRNSLLRSYDSAKAAVNKLNEADYDEATKTALTKVKALFAADSITKANSELVYAVAEYESFVENAGLADIDDDLYDAIDALIEKAERVLEYRNEYKNTTAANKAFETLEKKLDAAYAVSGDYSVTNSKLTTVKTELEAALNAVARFGTAASKATKDALAAAIKKADACKADAGYTTTGTSDAVKAFDAAYAAAKAITVADTEHVVADATDALLDAIDGLKVTPAKGSEVLAAQEDLEAAGVFGLVESDYTAASWKKFDAAMAAYDSAVTTKEVNAARDAVKDAASKLVAVSTRTEKNEFKALLKEAQALAKDTKAQATKSQAAVDAFKAAVAKAEKATPKTVSQYEAQISALTAAIDAYKNNKVVDAYEGWAYDNGTWYFFVKGEKATGWTWDGKNWYYMNDKGVMQTGWQKIDGAWYYLNTWGGMAKGWAKVNNTWYYLNPNGGKMVANGWNWINGKCYYFYASGAMAANTTVNGYKVGADGAWIK